MTYNHDLMVTYSMLAANQVMSLIFDGVFDRFPTLRIVLIEHAFNWILPLMWRMDAMYEARGPENGLKRKPSEYVKDHIWFTTQPLDYPEDKTELTRALEWMEADKILLFSSDYPHWTYDDPQWVAKHIPGTCARRSCSATASTSSSCPRPSPPCPGRSGPSEVQAAVFTGQAGRAGPAARAGRGRRRGADRGRCRGHLRHRAARPAQAGDLHPGVILGHEFAGLPGASAPPRRSCRWPSTRRRSPPSSTPSKRSRFSWTRGSERLPERRLSGQPDRWSRRIG